MLVGKRHYGCANTRNRGTCSNRLTIRRDILEETVLSGLGTELLHPDVIASFIEEYRKEWNRLSAERSQHRQTVDTELTKVRRQIGNIVEAIKNGLHSEATTSELMRLEERQKDLKAQLHADTSSPLPLLHLGLSAYYSTRVKELTTALNDDALRDEASQTIRALIEDVRLIPEDGQLVIELIGALAGILSLGQKQQNPSSAAEGVRQLTLVAGAGFEPAAFRL